MLSNIMLLVGTFFVTLVITLAGCSNEKILSSPTISSKWYQLLPESRDQWAFLIGEPEKASALITYTDEGKNIYVYKNPFAPEALKAEDAQYTSVNVSRPDGESAKINFAEVKLDGEYFIVSVPALNNSQLDVPKLLRAPRQSEYAFNVNFGLPFNTYGLWLINAKNQKIVPLTSLEINGYKYYLSNEAEIYYWVNDFIWNPDGTKIAYTSNRRDKYIFDLWIVDNVTGEHILVDLSKQSIAQFIDWPRDDQIIFQTFEGAIQSLNLQSLKVETITYTNIGSYLSEGRFLIKNPDATEVVLDINSKLTTQLPSGLPNDKRFLGINAREELIFFANDQIILISYETGKNIKKIKLPPSNYPVVPTYLGGANGSMLFSLTTNPINDRIPSTRSVWLYRPDGGE